MNLLTLVIQHLNGSALTMDQQEDMLLKRQLGVCWHV